MLLTFAVSLLIVSSTVSAGPIKRDIENDTDTMDSLLDDVGPSSTIYDAIATFQQSLAIMVNDLDFFDSSVNPVNWPLDNLDYDMDNKELTLSASYGSSIELIPSFLTMHSISVEIVIIVDEGDIFAPDSNLSLSLQSYQVSGSWTVGSVSFDLSVEKDDGTYFIEGSPQPSTVSVDSFFAALGDASFLPEDMASVLSSNAGLNSFSLQQTSLRVLYSKSFGYALALHGNPTIMGWGSFEMEMTLQRNAGSEKNVFVMTVQFSEFNLASLVEQLTGIDIANIPVIGSLILPSVELTIATGEPSHLLLANADEIQKGVTLVTSFSLGSNSPSLTYTIRLSEGNVTFEVSGESPGSVTVGELFDAVVPSFDSDSVTLPPGVPNVFDITFKDYYYDSDTKCIGVTVELGDDVNLVPGFVSVSNAYITITSTVTSPIDISVSGDADWKLGSKDFAITIERADDGDGYVVRGEGDSLKVGEILTQFSAALLPNELSSVLKSSGLDSFRIDGPVVQVPLGRSSNDFEMFFGGEPVIAGWSGVTLNAAIISADSSTAMAGGFEFVDTNFAGLIKSLTGVTVSFISLLDQSLQTAVVISPRTMTDVALTGSLLSQLEVKKGVSVIAVFSFPDDCKSDVMCQFATSALGADATLQLRSTITSATEFLIAAAVSDISLGSGLTLSEAALEFEIGTETSVGISGTLDLNNPDLTFIGAVRVGVQGLELSMKMVGIWENAFGIKWLAFGNAVISMSIKPGVPLPGLELGAEVQIGTEAGKELVGQAYVGFDPVLPDNNYYFASISSASIQGILDAFGMSVSIPRPLAESGFPNGLSSSFSLEEQEPVPGVIVPAGFRLNGTINILGYEMSADISLNPPTEFTIDMNMDPLNLANGLFKLYRSKNDPSKGPRFYAKVKPPSVTLIAEGYAKVLSTIEQSASLEITNTQYIMTVSGPFFGFSATLKVYANYGSLKSAAFEVYGLLSSTWRTKIADKVKEVIQAGADAATKAIDDAKKDVEKAQEEFDDANDDLKSAENAVKNLCKIKSCSKVSQCIGCTKSKCCKKKWGTCVAPCLKWDSCCTKATVTDPACETYNAGCAATRRTALAALATAQATVATTKKSLDAAKATLSATQATYKAGSDAASAITRLGVEGLINIQNIEFDVAIGVASGGQFSGTVQASFLGGNTETFSFNLRLNSISSMASDLAERIFPGI